MNRLLILSTLALALLLAACAVPPTEVPPSPMAQNTISPTQTQRPTPTLTVTLTPARFPTPTLDPKKVDPGLVYGRPCKAPCWFGLIPGKTTLQELLEITPRLSAIESPYVFPAEEGVVPVVVNTRTGSPFEMSVLLEMDRDKKILRSISSSALNFYYPLGQLLAQFGEPEAVYDMSVANLGSTCEEVSIPLTPTTLDTRKYVFYPQQGLAFTIITAVGNMLCPEMRVNTFCYYPPMTLQEALTDNRLADWCGYPVLDGVTEKDLIKWHGYGSGY